MQKLQKKLMLVFQVVPLIILTFMLIASNISAATYEMTKLQVFADWEVFSEAGLHDGHRRCHALSVPLHLYQGPGGDQSISYVVVSYLAPDQAFTMNVQSNLSERQQNAILLIVNNKTYNLNTDKRFIGATYSSEQDVAIINDFIENNDTFKVLSYGSARQVRASQYSLKGFIEALNYMRKYCN